MENNMQERINNYILAFLGVLSIYVLCAYCFDFFYDLNDDLAIKDILAGIYSGVPEAHTNQILYPLGFFLSILYRIFPKMAVFGLFLCGCFGMCFGLIIYRTQFFFQKIQSKSNC